MIRPISPRAALHGRGTRRAEPSAPATQEGDYIAHDFPFASGETLADLRLHYTTLGTPARDAHGRVTNAVLILHGTGGDGHQFLRPQFSDVLFVPGGLLDPAKYFIILPDGIGHGKSSKPSDGLHANFPHYDYDDMVAAQYALADQGPEGQSSAPRHGHVDGLHAFLRLGRDLSRLHGRADAARLPAGADRRTQPHVAQDGDGRDPERSGVERRRIHDRAAGRTAHGGGPAGHRRQRAAADAEDLSDARCGRCNMSATRSARISATLDANDFLYQVDASRNYDPSARLGRSRRR